MTKRSIACFLTTPKYVGGTETALMHAATGFRELGHDCDIIAVGPTKSWTDQSHKIVNRVATRKYDELESVLAEYDGIVLSNLNFHKNDKMQHVLADSRKIPKWTSGWHSNSFKVAEDFHHTLSQSPNWSGTYVSFWPTVRQALDDVNWEASILPLKPSDELMSINRSDTTNIEYDFVHIGRIDGQKGVYTFAAGLESMARRRPDLTFDALIRGASNQIPGGPFIHTISLMLEEWGWDIVRAEDNMRTSWVASNRAGSTITFGGKYSWFDLPGILSTARCYVNFMSAKAADAHLEYATLEALEAGCSVAAAADWPTYHYGSDEPRILGIPMAAREVRRPTGRVIYNDMTSTAVDTTYKVVGDILIDLYEYEKLSESDPRELAHRLDRVAHNRRVITEKHDPKIAAQAYLRALGLE